MSLRCPFAAREPGRPGVAGWVRRLFLFALLWWLLTGGSAESWLIGAPAVLLAAWMSHTLWAPIPLSLSGLVRFLPWFAYQSLAGASDVAMRAFQPQMSLYPGLVRHSLRLPPGASRVTLANVVTMLPGTLSADLDGGDLVIHTLDVRRDMHAMVDDLEPRIAAVFGLSLTPGAAQGNQS